MRSRFIAAAIVWLTAAPLWATAIVDATSFSPSLTRVIDFSTPALTPTNYNYGTDPIVTYVNTQFAALGATFNNDFTYNNATSPATLGLTYPNDTNGNAIGNFIPEQGPLYVPSVINFNTPITGVEFALGAGPEPVVVQAFLGNTLVDTASGNLGALSDGDIFGFVNESPFDSINIQLSEVFYVGNMHLSTPEPGSLVLLGIAGVGLCLAWRRHRNT